jgi:hypothetical protein
MVILASDFSGMTESFFFAVLILTAIAAASIKPAKRGVWWAWWLIAFPLFFGSLLTLLLVLDFRQLPWTFRILFPIPLLVSLTSIVLWLVHRRAKRLHATAHPHDVAA